MKISILGTGRWASCLAYYMDNYKKYDVLMWERITPFGESPLYQTHENEFVSLSKKVNFTHDLKKAIDHGDIVIISIISQQLSNLTEQLKAVKGYEKAKYCLCMKGIEKETGKRLSEIMIDSGIDKNNIAVWVGPGHVQSISLAKPTNMIISAYNSEISLDLQKKFSNKNFMRLSTSPDIIGTEISAAAKNVFGIAAGILEADGRSELKGSLIPASIQEISTLIDAVGGNPWTAAGLAFVGDFEATLFNKNSHNLTYGKSIIEYNSLDLPDSKMTAEGIMTSAALLRIRDNYNAKVSDSQAIRLPITEAVSNILNGNIPLKSAGLFIYEEISRVLGS